MNGQASSRRKVLYICHGHPAVQAGGAERYALELYEAVRDSREFEPIFLARVPPASPHRDTPFGVAQGDRHQYFWQAGSDAFDAFYLTAPDKTAYTRHFREFLLAHRPDIIHFQHTYFLGYDLIRQARNTLPDVPIVFTLHEYLPICHRAGQMVRTKNQELCLRASPGRCHECFPDISPQDFFMRERLIKSHFAVVDTFLAPSRFLLERYVDWGIPRGKIQFEDYGRHSILPVPPEDRRQRNRLGFFGQLNRFKGVEALLGAMRLLAGEDAHLWVHGANLELQHAEFQREFRALVAAADGNVTLAGPYHHEDLPKLMAGLDWVVVPSIWWENAPLVIQEAFQHGRPVICSDIGGMAEKVDDGVNGLHFRRGDPVSLAATIRRALSTPDLWDRLRAGIPTVYRSDDQARTLCGLYRSLIEARSEDAAPDRIGIGLSQVGER